jgi:hypothetical protein
MTQPQQNHAAIAQPQMANHQIIFGPLGYIYRRLVLAYEQGFFRTSHAYGLPLGSLTVVISIV